MSNFTAIFRVRLLGAVLVALCAVLAWPAMAGMQTAEATVTGVSDGDTMHVLIDGERVKVRLANIDAPEKKQDWGRRSEQALRQLVYRQQVRLSWREQDRYGRIVADVWSGPVHVNAELVRNGSAMVYERYSRDPSLKRLQEQAQSAKVGLWSQPNPVAPWTWRKQSREANE